MATGEASDPLVGLSSDQTDPYGAVSADGRTAVAVSREGEVLVYDLSGVK